MGRAGKYSKIIPLILEYLDTVPDNGMCPRPTLVKDLGILDSSATYILRSMEHDGLLKLGRKYFSNVQSVEITKKGRETHRSKFQGKSIQLPVYVKRYLSSIGLAKLFPIQQDFVNRGLLNNHRNVCVFGYPGSGKTLIAEMAMINEVHDGGKILYCTPYKALDWQKYISFKKSFEEFRDVMINIADGDSRVTSKDLNDARIVIATYERVLGAIRAKETWLDDVTLVCTDEITLLADDDRGRTIDTVITYLSDLKKHPRFITLSTLVGNTDEIAKWLDAERIIYNSPAFDIPVNECIVYANDATITRIYKSGREEPIQGIDPIETLVAKNIGSRKTTLVFVGRRSDAIGVARNVAAFNPVNPKLEQVVKDFFSEQIDYESSYSNDLLYLIPRGVAYHHAGLQKKIRRFIEDLLRQDMLNTIVATTTLSHGVDYKIDSVIIDIEPIIRIKRGLPLYEYINLKGRAGRPGKSKHADVYIVCSSSKAEEMFDNYFFRVPEPVRSTTTLGRRNLASIILLSLERSGTLESIADFAGRTFQGYVSKIETETIMKVSRVLEDCGFLTIVNGNATLTDLGRKVNISNMDPMDARKVLGLQSFDKNSILTVASQIDIAKKYVDPFGTIRNPVKVLDEWMKGKGLDAIRDTCGNYYDQDIIELVSYTSLSLAKMVKLIDDRIVKTRIERMRAKLNKPLTHTT